MSTGSMMEKTASGQLMMNAAPILSNTHPVLSEISDNSWLFIHCEAVRNGLAWENPIGLFVNKRTCGVKGFHHAMPAKIVTVTTQIPSNTGTLTQTGQTMTGILMIGQLKMLYDQMRAISREYRIDNNATRASKLRQVDEVFRLNPALSEQEKFGIFSMYLNNNGENFDDLKKLAEENNLTNILKIVNLFEKENDGAVAMIMQIFMHDNTFVVSVSDKKAVDNTLSSVTMGPIFLDKKGKVLEKENFSLELKNAPIGISLDEKANFVIDEEKYVPAEAHFSLLLTNKKTGATFSQEYKIVPREKKATSAVKDMTQKEVFDALNK